MSTFTLRAALAAAALGTSSWVASAAVPERALGALGQDDACSAGPEAGRGGCALQALQQRSARGLVHETPAAAPAASDVAAAVTASASGAAAEAGGAAAEPAAEAAAAVAAEPASTTEEPKKKSTSGWVWDEDEIRQTWNLQPEDETSAALNAKVADKSGDITNLVTYFCERWMAYNWVKVSFWGQQLLRRAEALPEEPSPSQREALQTFAKKASFLTCVWDFDPQSGTNWSAPVAEYMSKVAGAPDDDLELPKLDGWFLKMPQARQLYSIDACNTWVNMNMCDMGWLGRQITGKKASSELCWDKVPKAKYNVTVGNESIDLPFNIHVFAQDDDFHHPEFQACQEKKFTRNTVKDNCPMFGHYPKGIWGLEDFDWGDVPKKGSKKYKAVTSCEAKLGIPGSVRLNIWDSFPYVDQVGLMDTPAWRLEEVRLQKEAKNKTLQVVKNRLSDTLHGVITVMNTSVPTILNSTAKIWGSPESQSAWQAVFDAAKAGNASGNFSDVPAAMARALNTTNVSAVGETVWGITGAVVQSTGTILGNEIGAIADVFNTIGDSFNKSFFGVDYNNETVVHLDTDDLSLRPKEQEAAEAAAAAAEAAAAAPAPAAPAQG